MKIKSGKKYREKNFEENQVEVSPEISPRSMASEIAWVRLAALSLAIILFT